MLENNTKVKHKIEGYVGVIDGITRMKEFFTGNINCDFQYRVKILGEETRKIAPEQDLEVFCSREGMRDKARCVLSLSDSGFEENSERTICNFKIEARGSKAVDLVKTINKKTYEFVRSRTAELQLQLIHSDTLGAIFQLRIEGIGHDNRCRWCRTFRTKLENACERDFGEEMFFQDGFCVFEKDAN